MLERPVVGPFGVRREYTRWKFAAFQVVAKALAAVAFARTRFVRAVALLLIFLLFTLHSPSVWTRRFAEWFFLLIIPAEPVLQEIGIFYALLGDKTHSRGRGL